MAKQLAYRGGTLRSIRANRAMAGIAMFCSSMFMALMAVLLDSGSLFYMATALIATMGAMRLQAYLSVRGLRFERTAPQRVMAGDLVTIEIEVRSEMRVRRPLVTIVDNLPRRLICDRISPSLPIAPAFDLPIRTQYQIRPLKRGKYRWSGLVVEGTDALGLVTMEKVYPTDPVTMTVLPKPLPFLAELPTSLGFGLSEATSGSSKGAGMEPRGIREYVVGDPLRHVHWISSAKRGRLLVKEFEAGSNSAAAFIIQRTLGSEIGEGANTTLEWMCSHAASLSRMLLRKGARVEFPAQESGYVSFSAKDRLDQILNLLSEIQPDSDRTAGQEAAELTGRLPFGSVLYVMLAVQDTTLPGAAMALSTQGTTIVALVYDAHLFLPPSNRRNVANAADPGYLASLEAAGIRTVAVPLEAGKELEA